MTVAIAWVRKLAGQCEELVFCSDSRLSGGARIDCVPKIFTLSRSDCAICFAGDTYYAYPLMIQLSHAIEAYFPSRTRGMDIHNLKGHVLKVFNYMVNSVHDFVEGMDIPETSFIFGGYSSIQKSFALWSIQYHMNEHKFFVHSAKNYKGFGNIVFAGDRSKDAKKNLVTLLRGRYNIHANIEERRGFDMEPFEVIRDMLRTSGNVDSIGGPPQLVKIYQYMNSMTIGVLWPQKEGGNITFLGRPFLPYENSDVWILDPDTLRTSSIIKP